MVLSEVILQLVVVLTYEDVTNVDSVGVITDKIGVLVGSGITLSKDGDVFFTGVATGNGIEYLNKFACRKYNWYTSSNQWSELNK